MRGLFLENRRHCRDKCKEQTALVRGSERKGKQYERMVMKI